MHARLLLAAALDKIDVIKNGKRDTDLARLVLLENLVQKLTAVLQSDENGDDFEKAANGCGACGCAADGPSELARRKEDFQARTNGNVSLPDARMPSPPLAVEVYVISDYHHTRMLQKLSLKGLEYMMTYTYKVSLELQQLKPPIRVVLVAYQGTSKEKPGYVSFTSTENLDADNTVTKLRQYAGKSPSVQQSDLVVLITGHRLVDTSMPAGAPEMLGIAPLEGICSQYSVAIAKDLAGRYSGVHSTVHEMGHSFGSYHDGEGTSTKCPAADGYLMSPKSHGKHSEEFSVCSHIAISKYISSEAATCLRYAASKDAIGVYPRSFLPPQHGSLARHRRKESSKKVARDNKLK